MVFHGFSGFVGGPLVISCGFSVVLVGFLTVLGTCFLNFGRFFGGLLLDFRVFVDFGWFLVVLCIFCGRLGSGLFFGGLVGRFFAGWNCPPKQQTAALPSLRGLSIPKVLLKKSTTPKRKPQDLPTHSSFPSPKRS